MIPIPFITRAGAAVAAMSGVEDGDCGWNGPSRLERTRFLERIGVSPEALVALRQCHGDRVFEVGPGDRGRGATDSADALGEGDALITRQPGLPLGIHVADCVPVFLWSPAGVGLVHAGRAGTAQRITARTVQAMEGAFGASPASVFAFIGPSAGPCCYEVDSALREACVASGMAARGNHLDLWRSNWKQLVETGVPEAQIGVAGHCTICQPGFHSYRAQQSTKRNLAVIMR